MPHRLLLATLTLALFAGHAAAQDVRVYRSTDRVDPHDVARILDQRAPRLPAGKTRSIRLLDDAPSAQVVQADQPELASASFAARRPSALALSLQFSFDSAEIEPPARQQLDALAEGIRLLPEVQAVVIEGHTDAAGTEQYNELLSQRRAHSVKRYLVARHGIDAARLRAVGLGKAATLPGRDPYAPDNRRVQFRGE